MAQLVRVSAQGLCRAKHHGFHHRTTIQDLLPLAYLVLYEFALLFCLFVYCTGQQPTEIGKITKASKLKKPNIQYSYKPQSILQESC